MAQPDSYSGRWAKKILKEYLSGGAITDAPNLPQNKIPFSIPPEPLPPADRPANQPLKIGILGAGAAGMYAAMIIESLNDPMITYDLLEANPRRHGGRLFTYHFSQGENDYYDVGAMRFPDIPFMKRTFRLFQELDITEENELLIPYILSIDENLNLFNGTVLTNKAVSEGGADPFKTGMLPEPVNDLVYAKLSYFREKLSQDFDAAWEELVQDYDQHSTRSYMAMVEPKYSQNLINTLETFASATDHYDRALLETVLSSMNFDYPTGGTPVQWKCIQGGASVIADRMAARVTVTRGTKVTAIRPNIINPVASALPPGSWESMNVETLGAFNSSRVSRTYDHVITTLPFSCLRNVDTSQCGLQWKLSLAIRGLRYDDSVKVGIKFSHRWWETEKGQYGGVSRTDKPTRVVVYPSYGIGGSDAAMIVSYTFGQDAARLGALCQGQDTLAETRLISLILRDLSDLHGYDDYDYLPSLVQDYHAWDWYGNEYSAGAFAGFAPGQFQSLYPLVTEPYSGILHFAGEAASVHHGWLVGALNSAYRAIIEVLRHEEREDLIDQVKERWGDDDELDEDSLRKQVYLGQVMPSYLKARREEEEKSRL